MQRNDPANEIRFNSFNNGVLKEVTPSSFKGDINTQSSIQNIHNKPYIIANFSIILK
jgi:hypothetical protein